MITLNMAGASYDFLSSQMKAAVDTGTFIVLLKNFGKKEGAPGFQYVTGIEDYQVFNLYPSPVFKDDTFYFAIQASASFVYMGVGVGAVALGSAVYKIRTGILSVKGLPIGPTSMADCLLNLVLAIMLGCSNTIQVIQKISTGDYAVSCSILSLRFVVMCVSTYIIAICLLGKALRKMLVPEALHHGALWACICTICLLDPSLIRLLPWQITEFSKRSGGYPTYFIFRLSLFTTLFNATGMLIIASLTTNFHNLRSLIESAPFFLSAASLFLALLTVSFKMLAERLYLANAAVGTLHDIEFKNAELSRQEELLKEITAKLQLQKLELESKKLELIAQDREWLIEQQERIRSALELPELPENGMDEPVNTDGDGIELSEQAHPRNHRESNTQQHRPRGLSRYSVEHGDEIDTSVRLTYVQMQSDFHAILSHGLEDNEGIDLAAASELLKKIEDSPVYLNMHSRDSEHRTRTSKLSLVCSPFHPNSHVQSESSELISYVLGGHLRNTHAEPRDEIPASLSDSDGTVSSVSNPLQRARSIRPFQTEIESNPPRRLSVSGDEEKTTHKL